MWQDYVIAGTQWIFLIALIPSLVHREHKPALLSSVLTGTLLIVMGVTLATLGLWNGLISSLAVGAGWYVLAWQRYRLNRQNTSSR